MFMKNFILNYFDFSYNHLKTATLGFFYRRKYTFCESGSLISLRLCVTCLIFEELI